MHAVDVHTQPTHALKASRRPGRLAAFATLAAALGLALGSAQIARADDEGAARSDAEDDCSNRSLRGDYAFAIGGTIFAGPNQFLLRGVAMTHFDGHGNLTQVDFTTRSGVSVSSDWRPATGTYDVSPDCTGTAQIQFTDGSPTLKLRLVVSDRGRHVDTVVENQGTGSTGTKVR